MCFSAAVSLSVAAGTGLIGGLTVTKVSAWRQLPLAAMPLIFAAQQGVEGLLWLSLARAHDGILIGGLANLFMLCAMVLWPIWVPLAVALIEPDRQRKLALGLAVVLALAVSVANLRDIWASPYAVGVVQNRLAYFNGTLYSPLEYAAYVLCTCCPLLSSHRMVRLFGAIIATGLFVSTLFYMVAFISVWCIFAAAGSVVLHLHFAAVSEVVKDRRFA